MLLVHNTKLYVLEDASIGHQVLDRALQINQHNFPIFQNSFSANMNSSTSFLAKMSTEAAAQ